MGESNKDSAPADSGRIDRYHFANVINSGKLRPGLKKYHKDLEKEFKTKYQGKLGNSFFDQRAKSSKYLKSTIVNTDTDELNNFIENFTKK